MRPGTIFFFKNNDINSVIFNELLSKIINMEFELKTSGEADKYPAFFRLIITLSQ